VPTPAHLSAGFALYSLFFYNSSPTALQEQVDFFARVITYAAIAVGQPTNREALPLKFSFFEVFLNTDFCLFLPAIELRSPFFDE